MILTITKTNITKYKIPCSVSTKDIQDSVDLQGLSTPCSSSSPEVIFMILTKHRVLHYLPLKNNFFAICVSLQRFRCPAAWYSGSVRPSLRMLDSCAICLSLASLHKIALQSSAHSLRPFSRSPSTIPPDCRTLCGMIEN